MKNRSIRRILLALFVSFAVLLSSLGTQVAQADAGSALVTFTKWVICYSIPNGCKASDGTMVDGTMVGIITGGDAGTGSYSGEILNVTKSIPQIWQAQVRYTIMGTLHSFTALIDVTENDVTNTATLEGVVTDGWLKGSRVQGGYIILPASSCPHPEFGSCFQVTLHIHVGS